MSELATLQSRGDGLAGDLEAIKEEIASAEEASEAEADMRKVSSVRQGALCI